MPEYPDDMNHLTLTESLILPSGEILEDAAETRDVLDFYSAWDYAMTSPLAFLLENNTFTIILPSYGLT